METKNRHFIHNTKDMKKLSKTLNEYFGRVNDITQMYMFDSGVSEEGNLELRLMGQDVEFDNNFELVGCGMLNPNSWDCFRYKENPLKGTK